MLQLPHRRHFLLESRDNRLELPYLGFHVVVLVFDGRVLVDRGPRVGERRPLRCPLPLNRSKLGNLRDIVFRDAHGTAGEALLLLHELLELALHF